MNGHPIAWDFAVIFLVLGVVVPWHGAVRIGQLLSRPRLDTADRLALYATTITFQWAAVAVVAWRCHARHVSAETLGIALPDPSWTAGVTLALSLILCAIQFLSLKRLTQQRPQRPGLLSEIARKLFPQNIIEALAFFGLAATVALCEEFLYRGFAFAVLERASSGSMVFAALGSSALFALAHLYQGRRGLAATFIVGLVFAAARISTASLAPSIVAHLLVDLLAGLAAPRMLAASGSVSEQESVTAARVPGAGERP